MRKRGRKSASEMATAAPAAPISPLAPPSALKPEARALWTAIVASRPTNYFSPADLPLLRDYVHTVATLIPRLNELAEETLDARAIDSRVKLIRVATNLSGKLRLHVSSRTRPDTAGMRDSVRGVTMIDWSGV
jgi:hypothetical protein